MTRRHTHSLNRNAQSAWFGACLAFACATQERSFNDTPAHAAGATAAGTSSTVAGAVATAGKSNAGGSSNGGENTIAGGTANGGVATNGGVSANGGASTNGGTSTSSGGVSSTVGTSAPGGTQATGGRTQTGGSGGTAGASVGVGGASGATGGAPIGTGGSKPVGGASNGGAATSSGGATVATGGAPVATGGSPSNSGGASPTGGSFATGGATPTGGNAGTGGNGSCVPNEANEVSCNDNIDNDCDGLTDCPVLPIVGGRFPEPGIAAAGDDVWVRPNAPTTGLVVQGLECRTAKPNKILSTAWAPCITDPGDPARVFSMSGTDAKLATNDGVTQFDFRFHYTVGAYSETRSIVYYAHSSLADDTPMVSKLACKPVKPDTDYFDAATAYLVSSTTQVGFAASEVQLKNPFIKIQFTPPFLFGPQLGGPALTAPQKIDVFSLRHRFVVGPTGQMLLVTRVYQSMRNAPSCLAASLQTHEFAPNKVRRHPEQYNNHCDAIVMNKAGSGVCLVVSSGGTISIPDIHSAAMTAILQTIGIKWPKAEATMWQKLFDDRAGRNTLQYFSDKCITGDTACLNSHTKALILPDNTDPYFTSP